MLPAVEQWERAVGFVFYLTFKTIFLGKRIIIIDTVFVSPLA